MEYFCYEFTLETPQFILNLPKNPYRKEIAVVGLLAITFLFWKPIDSMFSEKQPGNFLDGPHLYIHDDHILEQNIVRSKNRYRCQETEHSIKGLGSVPLTLPLNNETEKIAFQVSTEFKPSRERFALQDKSLVISDIEGDFDYFHTMLLAAKVIDENYNWTWGAGHLVILGDVFDRGDEVTECLWLIYYLEQEAKKHGGKVHMILGNHEIMILSGDDRYINRKYKRISKKLKVDYQSFFGQNTVLGQWLGSKNAVEIIDNTLYVHGGLSPQLVANGLELKQINDLIRSQIHVGYSHEQLTPTLGNLVMGGYGPLWYRGYFGSDKIKESELDEILDRYDVKQIVVGHTLVSEMKSEYNRKLFPIDLKRTSEEHFAALMIVDGSFFKVDYQGTISEI